MSIIMITLIVMSRIFFPCRSHFMELYSITRIIFFSIKSYIREIVPYREECCIHEIGQEELIEHQDDTKWYDCILVTHHIGVVPRLPHEFLMGRTIPKPGEDIADAEDIALLYHIDSYSPESEEEKERNKHEQTCIESRMSRLADNKTAMKWEEYSKDKDKIHWDTHEKYRKSEWEKSTLSGEGRIPEKYDREKYVDTKSYDSTKCCLKELM